MGLYVKYLLSSIEIASRDKRELSVVKELGHEVLVCNLGLKDRNHVVAGFNVITRSKNRSKNKMIKEIQKVSQTLFSDPKFLKNLKADYLSCHDLYALLAGYISTLFVPKSQKPILIYDAHEFEIGRKKKRGKLAKRMIMVLEKYLMKKCAFSIMVNDSIADEISKTYKISKENRPIVVRSTPDLWQIDQEEIKKQRNEYIKELGMPDDTFILMYHGILQQGRGIENLIYEVSKTEGTALILLGFIDKEYRDSILKIASDCGVKDRVMYHKAVNLSVLWKYVGAADIGMIPTSAFCKNHYFMLPNKFFENIQSLTPLITSDYPEMSKLINKYNIGLCVDPDKEGNIAGAIEKVKENKDLYNKFKENLVKAKQDLCWENEKDVLKKELKKIMKL